MGEGRGERRSARSRPEVAQTHPSGFMHPQEGDYLSQVSWDTGLLVLKPQRALGTRGQPISPLTSGAPQHLGSEKNSAWLEAAHSLPLFSGLWVPSQGASSELPRSMGEEQCGP